MRKILLAIAGFALCSTTFAAESPEEWSSKMPVPSALENFLYDSQALQYSVSTHFRARFFRGAIEIPTFLLAKNSSALSDPNVELCWGAVLSGARSCLSYAQIKSRLVAKPLAAQLDLLEEGRKLAREYGMRTAAEFLKSYVHDQDSSGGSFEKNFSALRDLKQAHSIKMGGLEHSILEVPRSERAKVGIFFLMGMDHDPKTAPRARANVVLVSELQRMGFTSAVLNTTPLAPTDIAGHEIRLDLERQLPNVDSAIILGMSKAGHEMSQFFAREFSRLSPTNQRKIRAVVTLSGVVRFSFVAHWLANDVGPTRKFVNMFLGKKAQCNPSLAYDVLRSPSFLAHMPDLSRISWINVVVFPDRIDGSVHYSGSQIFMPWLLNANDSVGPNDGAVEVGAAVPLPAMQQAFANHVALRVVGTHYVTLGGRTLIDSRPVSYEKQSLSDFTAAQADYMGNILGVIPSDWISD